MLIYANCMLSFYCFEICTSYLYCECLFNCSIVNQNGFVTIKDCDFSLLLFCRGDVPYYPAIRHPEGQKRGRSFQNIMTL